MSLYPKRFIWWLASKAGYAFDSKSGRWVAGAATGVGATGIGASAVLSALGFTAVSHSSGVAILTGAGGYVAGTYGVAAVVGWLLWLPTLIFLGALTLYGGFVLFGQKLGLTKK